MKSLQFSLRSLTTIGALFFFLACSFTTFATPGQSGTLDAFFATGSSVGAGKAITPIGPGSDRAFAMTLQPDGKMVLAGACDSSAVPNWHFCALRYLQNGTPDPDFGIGGTVITTIKGASTAQALFVQPDGKIVMAGWCFDLASSPFFPFCALRYNVDGSLDLSFGLNGKVITTVGTGNGSDAAYAAALQPDGKMVLAGGCYNGTNNDFCAARYDSAGQLDNTFGSGGKVIAAVGSNDDVAKSVAIQPDGKIVLAGTCSNGSSNEFCAMRLNASGLLDTGFNATGKVITAIGSGSDAQAVALQPDGRILVAGKCSAVPFNYFCVLRYNVNGSLDTSFGGTGRFLTQVGSGNDFAYSIALQPDGKILLAGNCTTGGNDDFCMVRYHPNGILDVTFNGTGKVITPVGSGNDLAKTILLQPDGKILIAGYCDGDRNTDFCVARYDSGPFGYKNCSLDVDGDGRFLATTDALINMRIALGITGPAVIGGITFAPNATRNTWPLIRDFLVTQCGVSLVQ